MNLDNVNSSLKKYGLKIKQDDIPLCVYDDDDVKVMELDVNLDTLDMRTQFKEFKRDCSNTIEVRHIVFVYMRDLLRKYKFRIKHRWLCGGDGYLYQNLFNGHYEISDLPDNFSKRLFTVDEIKTIQQCTDGYLSDFYLEPVKNSVVGLD